MLRPKDEPMFQIVDPHSRSYARVNKKNTLNIRSCFKLFATSRLMLIEPNMLQAWSRWIGPIPTRFGSTMGPIGVRWGFNLGSS